MKYLTILIFGILFITNPDRIHSQTSTIDERVYIRIEVKGLACPFCAYGMKRDLKKISGVEKVDIELKKGLAYISTPLNQKPTEGSLRKLIVDAGFTPGKIEFRDHPFERMKEKDN